MNNYSTTFTNEDKEELMKLMYKLDEHFEVRISGSNNMEHKNGVTTECIQLLNSIGVS